MKKFAFGLGSILMLSFLLVGCQEKDVPVEKDNVTDQVVDESKSKEDFVPGTISKEDYKYTDYVNGEKASFYETNQIFLGEEFNQKEDVYLVYLFSPLCVYCDQFYTTLKAYEGSTGAYPVYKMNVDIKENIRAWQDFEMQGTPTLLLVDKHSKSVIDTVLGFVPIERIPTKN